ncbi:MAG TPA: bifunctional NADP-dependent methylenetetrahydromethanopterin dehydrogenase/methylenetetrahydrofolate dehydrogenase, partial [Pirellulales bacterium]|nr:bifunctional NADP-dependent methylenetetrahydromethanopterin dehydrogenase/methylenetetrahydrofolate dehydrogenase [Pirellulales bacterium]
AKLVPRFVTNESELRTALDGAQIVIAAGPPGVRLLSEQVRRDSRSLQVAVDLNAVPPLGIEGVESADRGQSRDRLMAYGAIGVGGLKMKAHKRAIQRLFETNDALLDAEEVFELASQLAD